MAQPGAVTAVVIGAGHRGRFAYGGQALAHPERLRIVAVAEPDAARRDAMAREHGLGAGGSSATGASCWQGRSSPTPRSSPPAIRCTWPRPSRPWPAATTCCSRSRSRRSPPTASGWSRAAETAGRILQIGHVLRYTAFYRRVHEIVASGRLGRVWQIAARGARRRLAHGALLRARPLPQPRDRGADPAREELSRPRSAGLAGAGPPGAGRLLRPALRLHRSACAAGSARALHAGLPGPGELRPRRGALLPRPRRRHRSRLAVERRVPRSLAGSAPPRARDGPLRALRLPLRQRRARSPARRGRVRGRPDGVASACTATPCTRAACCASPASRASCAACSSAGSSRSSATARSRASASRSPARRSDTSAATSELVAHFADVVTAQRAAGGAHLGTRGARGAPARLRRRAGPRAGPRGRARCLSPRDRGGGRSA